MGKLICKKCKVSYMSWELDQKGNYDLDSNLKCDSCNHTYAGMQAWIEFDRPILHPEIRADEIYIGNTDSKDLKLSQYKEFNARFAQPAYSIDGEELSERYHAIFVPKSHYGAYNQYREKFFSDIKCNNNR
jgi:hypothetical protein